MHDNYKKNKDEREIHSYADTTTRQDKNVLWKLKAQKAIIPRQSKLSGIERNKQEKYKYKPKMQS